MDIVSRLKLFLDTMNIPNSQFADNCRIPRPTISQVLNGRNKKISDELISKIHATYPSLSMLWLLFGEGRMLSNENIEISDVQNQAKTEELESHIADEQQYTPYSFTQNIDRDSSSEKKISFNSTAFNESSANVEHEKDIESAVNQFSASLSNPQGSLKKITNIVVFYNDNSFQSFSPSQI